MMKKEKIVYEDALAALKVIYPLANPNKYFEEKLKSLGESIKKEKTDPNFDLLGS